MKRFLLPALILVLLAMGMFFFYPSPEPQPTIQNSTTALSGEQEGPAKPLTPSPEELLQQQRLIEHARPQEFIDLSYEVKKNLLGESVVEGTFLNQADMTTYRDIQLMVYFQDEKGTALDSASQVVFEVLERGVKKEFRIKERGPKRSKVVVQIARAKVIPEK